MNFHLSFYETLKQFQHCARIIFVMFQQKILLNRLDVNLHELHFVNWISENYA